MQLALRTWAGVVVLGWTVAGCQAAPVRPPDERVDEAKTAIAQGYSRLEAALAACPEDQASSEDLSCSRLGFTRGRVASAAAALRDCETAGWDLDARSALAQATVQVAAAVGAGLRQRTHLEQVAAHAGRSAFTPDQRRRWEAEADTVEVAVALLPLLEGDERPLTVEARLKTADIQVQRGEALEEAVATAAGARAQAQWSPAHRPSMLVGEAWALESDAHRAAGRIDEAVAAGAKAVDTTFSMELHATYAEALEAAGRWQEAAVQWAFAEAFCFDERCHPGLQPGQRLEWLSDRADVEAARGDRRVRERRQGLEEVWRKHRASQGP